MRIVAKNDAGEEIKIGDTLTDFRGDKEVYAGCDQRGRNRVYTKDGGEYFAQVFDLHLEAVE